MGEIYSKPRYPKPPYPIPRTPPYPIPHTIDNHMKIHKVNSQNPDQNVLNQVFNALKQGQVIVYPTETSYGLGGDALNRKVVERIYKIKGRDFQNPLPIIVSSKKQLNEIARINNTAKGLIKKYWPGPLTLVLPVKELPQFLLRGKSTIALRISSCPLVKILVKELGHPLVSTSANISGGGDCYSAKEVLKHLSKRKYEPDLILDAGPLPRVKPSSIVEVAEDGIRVLRKGPVVVDE